MAASNGADVDRALVSEATRAMARGQVLTDAELGRETAAFVAAKEKIILRLAELNAEVRTAAGRLARERYAHICAEQNRLRADLQRTDARLRELKSLRREVAEEWHQEKSRTRQEITDRLDRVEALLKEVLRRMKG